MSSKSTSRRGGDAPARQKVHDEPANTAIAAAAQPFAADQAYGRLVEGVHIAGYSLERAWQRLAWLLQEDRWRSVGGGYNDINAFLDSIRLDNFRMLAEQRKDIARQIKELQPEASNVTGEIASCAARSVAPMSRATHEHRR
jgi:hypothetical protein